MSATQPDDRFKYSELTEAKALHYLAVDFGGEAVGKWRKHIKSATDVLYYADAFGDFSDAILLQGFDKTLPARAHRGLLDSGLDIYEAVNCHDMETKECPGCDAEMWAFGIYQGDGHTSHEWVDEHGNTDYECVTWVENTDGRYWNPDKGENDAPIVCAACSMDTFYDFDTRGKDVRIHYGETDKISGFKTWNRLVYFEDMDRGGRYEPTWTDIYGVECGGEELAKAFAIGRPTPHMNEYDWEEISESIIKASMPPSKRNYKVGPEYRRLTTEWLESDEPHPDLDFTYIIEDSTFGYPSFWVATENREALIAEITDLIGRRLN